MQSFGIECKSNVFLPTNIRRISLTEQMPQLYWTHTINIRFLLVFIMRFKLLVEYRRL